jgi:hypothetical protein
VAPRKQIGEQASKQHTSYFGRIWIRVRAAVQVSSSSRVSRSNNDLTLTQVSATGVSRDVLRVLQDSFTVA